MMFLMLVMIGTTMAMAVMFRIGDRVGVHVNSCRILGCRSGFICLDVCTEAVLVSNIVNMTMNPMGILVSIGSLDLMVA